MSERIEYNVIVNGDEQILQLNNTEFERLQISFYDIKFGEEEADGGATLSFGFKVHNEDLFDSEKPEIIELAKALMNQMLTDAVKYAEQIEKEAKESND